MQTKRNKYGQFLLFLMMLILISIFKVTTVLSNWGIQLATELLACFIAIRLRLLVEERFIKFCETHNIKAYLLYGSSVLVFGYLSFTVF